MDYEVLEEIAMAVSKDSKTGVWRATFYYTDWKGERVRKRKSGFKTQKEAKAWEHQQITIMEHSCEGFIKDLAPIYLEAKQKSLKASTYANYKFAFNRYIIPYFGNKKVNEIKPIDIHEWHLYEMNRGMKVDNLRVRHVILSSFLNYLVRFYGLKANPCNLCGPPPASGKRKSKFWTYEQYTKAMNWAIRYVNDVKNNRMYQSYLLIINILYWTGMRIGEVMALRSKDITNGVIHVTRSVMLINKMITTPKTRSSIRDISISQTLQDEINEFIRKIPYYNEEDLLFNIATCGVGYFLSKICEHADVPKIRIHDLRHSHASFLIEKNYPIIAIKERLGHKNIQTTLDIYGHLYPNKDKEIADEIDHFIIKNDQILT